MFKCPKLDCKKEYDNVVSLTKHWGRYHKLQKKELYKKIYNIAEPTCACGCGDEVNFLDISRGFRKFVKGHASRVPGKNNFVSKKAQENSVATRRKMFAEGELQIWNKGKTKETHLSVRKYGKNGSKTIRVNSEEIKTRSERMRQGRLDGTVPTLRGPEHSQWKGGTSSLNSVCRSNKKLYMKWTRVHLIRAKYTCEECGYTGRLQVHHDQEKFSTIVRKFSEQHNWPKNFTEATQNEDLIDSNLFTLKRKIARSVADYHVDNNVSGIALCKNCHKKKHPNLNF